MVEPDSFFDPLVNILPLMPLFIVSLSRYMKNRGKWNGKFNKFCTFVTKNRSKLYIFLVVVPLVWLTVLPVAKILLINSISETEGTKISYQDTYPSSFGKFLTAYQCNSTHYKVMEVSYWSGIEKSEYIEKINVTGNISDASAYVKRAAGLYSTAVPQKIDYPVYNVSEEHGSITVMLSDARNSMSKIGLISKQFTALFLIKKAGSIY